MLEVKSLSKKYGEKTVFEDLELSAEAGEIIGLVGENGAGKSTLLKILATLSLPSSGEISLMNQTYRKNEKKLREYIAYVPQDIALFEELTVMENMKFFQKLSRKKVSKEDLKALLSSVNLQADQVKVSNLSGGMKRKLNLAVSLISDPKLLLLDEPTAGIDLRSRIEIGAFLKKLALEKNILIIYTSHDMNEIEQVCSRVVIIGEDPFYSKILKDFL
ncbi:ABC transporter ATP-binding protein [Jeotgalicoccus meleagridis]|uniref:Putative ABC transporter ATP-binding protein YxlF n=1 Tax=Jeotgalicoccus meleagridis TaxID=2759181 RepID=A0A6V7R2F0_9STAP|nr:ABC transporter ATP-binding protein [Jeotgalicoccus meleagridis]CAD2071395.1 putative ABC transporter ATP-binding protein YxlF [Jeotgalicoccus meleagridis]HIW38038.1 ABC transporter ATP-binding protein [Candidatus Jeotgalicoccus stercoravium]